MRVHAPPLAGARARASRAFFSSAAVVVRVVAAEVEDVHAEENHAAELVHDKIVEPVRAAVHAGEPVCAVRVCERDPQREKVSVGKKKLCTLNLKMMLAQLCSSSLCSFEMCIMAV